MDGEGRNRVVIEGVTPRVECGEFAIKRVLGDRVVVEADVFADGREAISGVLRYRSPSAAQWSEVALQPLGNNRWRGVFTVAELGLYRYSLLAWVERFASWSRDLAKRVDAGEEVTVDLLVGAALVEAAATRAAGPDAERLRASAARLRAGGAAGVAEALSAGLAELLRQYDERPYATASGRELAVVVDREIARFGAWYELFPRSCSPDPTRSGTLRDVERRLDYLATLGIDVLYLPPIHPIGRLFRKGRNNRVVAEPEDPGSPWAIGAAEGGHKAVHPELGTLGDFRHLVARAAERGIGLALDLAFQCAPDHPYVASHPEWFRRRPDGTVQYAENPPKKYQDIYPFDFETDDWQGLWEELRSVVEFWIEQGVLIYRVDNPHTKPFAFWEWLISEIKARHPGAIFLAEAFTRPRVMQRLAKVGFTQSYNYFPWRNTKRELTEYLTELTQSPLAEYFGANLWPNTPDILPEYLQDAGRGAFAVRLVLASTLGTSYGMYGPAFELGESRPLAPGREEYLDSEKYEVKHWDWESPESLRGLIGQVNRIRREHLAFRTNQGLRFQHVDNEQIVAYTRSSADRSDQVLVVVNLDWQHEQTGTVALGLDELELPRNRPYQVHDLLSDTSQLWYGARNRLTLNPAEAPARIFSLRGRARTEQDFDYYM